MLITREPGTLKSSAQFSKVLEVVNSELSVESENAGGDERPAGQKARVVQQVACGRIVRAIDDYVIRKFDAIFGELRK